MIKFCPNCGSELRMNNPDLSQGCKNCPKCGGVFYIIETTEPKIKVIEEDMTSEDILKDFMKKTKLSKKEVLQKLNSGIQVFKVELQKLHNLKNE